MELYHGQFWTDFRKMMEQFKTGAAVCAVLGSFGQSGL